jgi:two-component system cell cycle response regulator DivK
MEERKGSSVELGVPELPSETGDVVHQSPRVAFVPRIRLLIAEALSGDEKKVWLAGCDAYVAKPFSPRQLLAKVKEYL